MAEPDHVRTTAPLVATAPESERRALGIRWIHPVARPDSRLDVANQTFGRGSDCQFVLEGSNTSRTHARVLRRGGTLLIEDLNSRNGTYCDARKVELSPLELGCVVRLGEWVGVVVESAAGRGELEEVAPGLYGSQKLATSVQEAQVAARSRLPVLITGETGTGKELLAHAVHAWSGRRGRLLALNCAALVDSLLDAELFGHERGAFTGAVARRQGLVRDADGGTLFLDELAELSPSAQAKLLRVLQEREVIPVGGSRQQSVDLRVVSATHRDLEALAAEGTFRRDLYARLHGVKVELPALRKRREDIFPLFCHFVLQSLGRRPSFSARFVETLCTYDWLCNVRELKQCAERLSLACDGELEWHRRHLLKALPAAGLASKPVFSPIAPEAGVRPIPGSLGRAEIVLALEGVRGNVTHAAQKLGMARETLYRLLRVHSIVLDELRPNRQSSNVVALNGSNGRKV